MELQQFKLGSYVISVHQTQRHLEFTGNLIPTIPIEIRRWKIYLPESPFAGHVYQSGITTTERHVAINMFSSSHADEMREILSGALSDLGFPKKVHSLLIKAVLSFWTRGGRIVPICLDAKVFNGWLSEEEACRRGYIMAPPSAEVLTLLNMDGVPSPMEMVMPAAELGGEGGEESWKTCLAESGLGRACECLRCATIFQGVSTGVLTGIFLHLLGC